MTRSLSSALLPGGGLPSPVGCPASPSSAVPHDTQKRAPANVASPQAGQVRSIGDPQAMQNCAAAGFSAAQVPQVRTAFIVPSMMTPGEAHSGIA